MIYLSFSNTAPIEQFSNTVIVRLDESSFNSPQLPDQPLKA
ncbi:MAG: hypothetical protein OXC03_05310 [Flavobacteriaceae bacterium]|nr:hypothetical protein [Flavobacteriaceae bacterium]